MNTTRLASLLDRQKRYLLADLFHAGCVAALLAPMVAAVSGLV